MTKDELLQFQPPVGKMLGREILEVDTVHGGARLSFLAKPEFANRHGTVQGGLIAAMLDSATALALAAVLPAEQSVVTMNLNVSFLKPAKIGPFIGTSKLLSHDSRYGETSAELHDPQGVLVATATAKLRIMRRKTTQGWAREGGEEE